MVKTWFEMQASKI